MGHIRTASMKIMYTPVNTSFIIDVKMGFDEVYSYFIMLTCPCYVHPLTLHFYIVKLGFTGVYIIFLVLLVGAQSLEPPH